MTAEKNLSAPLHIYPARPFSNFTWTQDAIKEWDEVWGALWQVGAKWEWQNGDWYARQYGDVYNKYTVHNDAARLDMTIPLPGVEVIDRMATWLLGAPVDDHYSTTAATLLRKWIKNYA